MSFKTQDDRHWLTYMLKRVELVDQFIAGRSDEEFMEGAETVYAVTRCLEIISEESRRLSETMKERNSHIFYKERAGTGKIYNEGRGKE